MKPHDYAMALSEAAAIFMYLEYFLDNGSGILFGFLFAVGVLSAYLTFKAVELIKKRILT